MAAAVAKNALELADIASKPTPSITSLLEELKSYGGSSE
jgi:hypothetical protein